MTSFPPLPSRCRAVLFDASGTLIISSPTPEEALAQACRALRLKIDLARAAEIYAAVQDKYRAAIVGEHDRTTSQRHALWQGIFRSIVDAAFPQAGAMRIESEMARVKFGWRGAEDARRVLRAIRASGKRIGVVSNFDASLRQVLADVGLMDDVDAVVASVEVGCEKPNPRIFEPALKMLGVSAQDAIHVGDDAFDVVGAAAAGIAPVWLNASGKKWKASEGSNAEPNAVIRRLADLLPLLGIVRE